MLDNKGEQQLQASSMQPLQAAAALHMVCWKAPSRTAV
jgi:hypothetical protein